MAWWYGYGWWGPGWGWRRGWGRGWGWRRGGFGWGRGWVWWVAPQVISAAASRGYTYIGPCRSGIGPWAFYLSPSGQVVHAWQIFGSGIPFPAWPWTYPITATQQSVTAPVSEREQLEREREYLRRELQEIERRLKELEGGGH
ncbi:MAG: hypothetical protein QI197_07930 [Candidatus Korarchaeota archaeon]|nr:hypothetical protein [Candidatus Korarchaeota archaeon]